MVHVSDPCARVQVLASFDHIVLELHGVRAKPPPTPLSPLSPPQRAAAHHRALVGGQVSELLPMRRRAATLAKLNLFFFVVHVHVNNHGLDRRAGLARKFERVLGCVHWWDERAIDRAHPRGQPAALPPPPGWRILLRYDVPTTLEVSLVSRRLVPDLSRVVRASRRLPIDGLDHPNVRAPDVLLNVWPWA